MQLSETLKEKLIANLKGRTASVYYDHNDRLEADAIYKAIKEDPEDPKQWIYDQVDNFDTYRQLQQEQISEAIAELKTDFIAEFNLEDFDADEIAGEIVDDYLDYVEVEDDMDELLRGVELNVRIELVSNYEWGSWFNTTRSPLRYEDNLKEVLQVLRINPAEFKGILKAEGFEVAGYWPPRKGDPAVDPNQLYSELENISCACTIFTFIGIMDANDVLSDPINGMKIKLPVGTSCGFFSSALGGGSQLDMVLQREFEVEINKTLLKDDYLKFQFEIDCRSNRYSIDEAYGLTRQGWGKELKRFQE